MKQVLVYFIVFLLEINLAFSSNYNNLPPEVERPPRIIYQSNEVVYAILRVPLKLKCVAEAVPRVQSPEGYTWFKNGKRIQVATAGDDNLEPGSIVSTGTDGIIKFWKSETMTEAELKSLEGVYFCQAENEFGTAMTNNMTVKLASAIYQAPQNEVLTAEEGQSFTLPCHYEVQGGSEVTWSFSKTDVGLSNRIGQMPDGSLVFSYISAELDDNLGLFCTVKDKVTRISIDGIHYTIKVNRGGPTSVPPQITYPKLGKQVVLLGETIRLTCIGTGKPAPTLEWTKLSGNFPSDRTTTEDFGRVVLIRNASFDDTSLYRCQCSVDSNLFVILKIKVESKPYFTGPNHQPVDVTRPPGANVTIHCQPEGIPPPTVEWRCNGKPLEETSRIFVHDRSLKLVNLTRNDSSVFQCLSSNSHGSIVTQEYVNVLTWKPVPRPGNQFIYKQIEGNKVTLKCRIFGSPSPTITWFKNNSVIEPSERCIISKSNHLEITDLVSDDAGSYSCKALNEFGNYTLNFTLKVLKPTTLNTSEVVVAIRGRPAVFIAQVVAEAGNPRMSEVEWFRSGVVVERGTSFVIPEADFSDAGLYRVRVQTKLDSVEKNINLIVIDRPQPPSDFSFHVSNDDPLYVEFNWIPGNDYFSQIIEYRIEFEEDVYNPGTWQELTNQINGRQTSVGVKLNAGVNYKFRAFARNEVGWSLNSSTETRRYKTPDGLPVLPFSMEATGILPGVVEVTWPPVPGILQHAPGFGCSVRYGLLDGDVNDWTEVNVSADVGRYVFEGEQPYVPYWVNLTSFNNEGLCPQEPLQTICYTGEETPGDSPQDFRVVVYGNIPEKVTCSWTGINESDVRGILMGYNVSVTEQNTRETTYVTAIGEDSVDIIDLQPGTSYEFQAAAFTGAGNGPFCDAVSRTTPSGMPEPGYINVTQSNGKALLIWTYSGGLPADDVTAHHRISNDDRDWQEAETQPGVNNTARFEIDIDTDFDYDFRVVVTNSYGSVTSEPISLLSETSEPASENQFSIWIIVILCLVGLLILIIVIICLVRKKKGGKYSVNREENRFGERADIESEDGQYSHEADLKQPLTGPTDAGTSNGNPSKTPRHLRGDSIGSDSIEDPKEFNEDGSFIGQYGVINSPSSNDAPSTPPNESNTPIDNRNEGLV